MLGALVAVGLSGLLLFVFVRVTSPVAPSSEPADRARHAVAEVGPRVVPEASEGAIRIEDFKLRGNHESPTVRDRCSEQARREMASVVGAISDGDVFVVESYWRTRATSARVGIASWLSQCTQEGRQVRILGDETRALLATYDRQRGYIPYHDAS